MYRKFFGLNGLPFKSSPDIGVFYKNGSRQNILEALVYTVTRGDGITKVTGEVGSGKTMLLRLLAASLPKRFTVLYINTPNLSPKDMLMHICSELGLIVDDSLLKFSLLNLINKTLVKLYSEGQRVVMLIDEAQAMTFDTLEEIRLLSNLETHDEKLLQIVLFGQSELDTALSNDVLRQLKSRISYSIFIPALSPEEVHAYLNYRLRKASYDGLDVFDINVSRNIHKLSGGIPRTVNLIADKLLMSAYSSDSKKVTKRHIAMLPKEIGIFVSNQNNDYFKIWLLLGFMLFVLVLLYVIFSLRLFHSSPPVTGYSNAPAVHSFNEAELADALTFKEESFYTPHNISISENTTPKIMLSKPERIEPTFIHSINQGSFLKNSHRALENAEEGKYFVLKGSMLLNRLVNLHKNTVEWLMKMPEQMYIIQLAAPHINTLDEAIIFYTEQNIPIESIHFLIDLGRTDQKNRFRVLYLASASYSTLQRIISELPVELKESEPYVVTVGGVLKNLEYTQNNLKQHGIINVSQ